MKQLPTDAWSRSKAVLGLVAGLSGQELRHRVRAGLSGSVEKLRASDLDVLQKLGKGWRAVSRSKIDLAGVFEELRSILHLEADYRHELASQLRFAQLVEHDPRFVVPRSLPQLSTTRVHTMTWEEGQPLGQWLQGIQPQADRLWLAQLLLELYCLEFFRWGLVQTDPNFGNFLVRSDVRELVLLDFGATLEFEPPFRQGYVQLLRVVASGDTRRIGDEGVTFGLIDARESRETRELFAQFLTVAIEPFAPSLQPFAFRDAGYAERSQDVGRRFVRSLQFSPPPRRLLFLHRKLGGIFQLLKRLDLELDLRPYWERMIQSND